MNWKSQKISKLKHYEGKMKRFDLVYFVWPTFKRFVKIPQIRFINEKDQLLTNTHIINKSHDQNKEAVNKNYGNLVQFWGSCTLLITTWFILINYIYLTALVTLQIQINETKYNQSINEIPEGSQIKWAPPSTSATFKLWTH